MIVGYDARVASSTPAHNNFKLRSDVTSVFSVDENVWPSIIDKAFPRDYGSRCVQDLWNNIPDLQSAIRRLGFKRNDYIPVAISLEEECSTKTELESWIERLDNRLNQKTGIEFAHELLGYDVGDFDLISGLSNCEYDERELGSLVPVWAFRLNRVHLFDDLKRGLFLQTSN